MQWIEQPTQKSLKLLSCFCPNVEPSGTVLPTTAHAADHLLVRSSVAVRFTQGSNA